MFTQDLKSTHLPFVLFHEEPMKKHNMSSTKYSAKNIYHHNPDKDLSSEGVSHILLSSNKNW